VCGDAHIGSHQTSAVKLTPLLQTYKREVFEQGDIVIMGAGTELTAAVSLKDVGVPFGIATCVGIETS
jgi:hypothetical protein